MLGMIKRVKHFTERGGTGPDSLEWRFVAFHGHPSLTVWHSERKREGRIRQEKKVEGRERSGKGDWIGSG